MKMVMIAYNSAIDSEVIQALAKCGVEKYTKWTRVQGKGSTSEPHFGSEIWPAENSVIFTAIDDEKVSELFHCVKELRGKLGKEGVKAFAWDLETIT